ncbi:reverse transcriptase N-terminal domain-containing protein [Okeania sp. SIO1I7]|uniref:reverse transcriptase N-terminal domain-containing protein n=1 Tax=Okeania sp. SIO1I7 TaxID=2607772 RepID=UPI0025F6F0A1|nr:reverse transcriptase N-terminal domain-containing protein [Okeania sp. SIO1I7]
MWHGIHTIYPLKHPLTRHLNKWKDINWKQVEKYVFKLQKLIYKASSCGEFRKMHKYQKLLNKSYNAVKTAKE